MSDKRGPAVLRYHRMTLDILELPAVIAPDAAAQIAEAERASGRVLPASLREWALLDLPPDLRGGAVSYPPRRDELLAALCRVPASGPYAGLLYLTGDGGDGSWFARLDGGDDPPVVGENEPAYGDEELHVVSPRFSEWLRCGLFPCLRYLTAPSVDRAWESVVLDYLQDHFAHAFTAEVSGTTYHYFAGEGRWVCVSPPGGGVVAEWWVSAQTGDRLAALLRELWPFGGFAAGVRGFGAAANDVVVRVRRELARP
jgi:hypothetical protein